MNLQALVVSGSIFRFPKPSDFLASLIIGLKNQVSDLALKVFIPLNRLVPQPPPSIVGRITLEPFFLSPSARNTLQYFEQSPDLKHLESILRILEGGPLKLKKLPVLSGYFEALSVHGGALTDSHWTSDEDKLILSIWSMLSYYTHCSAYFSVLCPALLDLINDHLLTAFQKDAPLFREIFEYEKRKEERNYLIFRLMEAKIRKFHELRSEESVADPEEDAMYLIGLSAMANFSECQELELVKTRRLLTQKEKIEWGERIWYKLASENSALRDRVMQSREVIMMEQEIEKRKLEMEARKAQIDQKTQKAALNRVKKEIQSLYECEQLEVALNITTVIIESPQKTPIEAWIQWLAIIREAFKVVVSEDCLNINAARSIHSLSDMITEMRDYYEHPEDYSLQISDPSAKDEGEKRRILENELVKELPALGHQVKKLLEERLKKIKKLIMPHPQIDPKEALEALASRDSDKKPVSSKEKAELTKISSRQDEQRKFVKLQFPKIAHFTRSIQNQKAKVQQDSETLIKLVESLRALTKSLFSLSNGHSSSSGREGLESLLDRDLFFRLKIQREINVIARYFEQFMKIIKKIDFEQYALLEESYFLLRNVRNFQTHDLWRKNIKGLVDTVYLLVFDTTEIFMSLFDTKRKRFSEGSLEEKMVQKVVWNKLNQPLLEEALESGLELQSCDSKGRTLLHFLAEHPSETNLTLAKLVISKGANIHWADCAQMRPLHYAAESGFDRLASYLINQGAVVDVSSSQGTPVEIAQRYENIKTAQLLSAYRGIKRSTNAKALVDAVKNLDVARIQSLAKQGFDSGIDHEGKLPLVVLFEIEEKDPSLLLEIAHILLEMGASIDQQEPATGQTVLHAACVFTDHPSVIEFLMMRLPDVNCLDNHRQTPLHSAVRNNHANWVSALLRAKASMEMYDIFGHSPLLNGCMGYGCSEKIIVLLLQYGANPEAESTFGRVLHHLAERGTSRAVALVLNKGASPLILGKEGLFSDKLPYELSRDTAIKRTLLERMEYLISHLLPQDQEALYATRPFANA